MLQTGLQQLIATNDAIKALLTTPARADGTDGVFPLVAITEAKLPYIVFQRVSGEQVRSYGKGNKLFFARFRFTCYSGSYPTATALAEAIKQLLAEFTGTLSEGTYLGDVALVLEADDAESVPRGTIYGVHLDYEIAYTDVELGGADGSFVPVVGGEIDEGTF